MGDNDRNLFMPEVKVLPIFSNNTILSNKTLDYLTPIEYIEEQLPKIRSPAELLPMWSA
jgi:hypothetical protein